MYVRVSFYKCVYKRDGGYLNEPFVIVVFKRKILPEKIFTFHQLFKKSTPQHLLREDISKTNRQEGTQKIEHAQLSSDIQLIG